MWPWFAVCMLSACFFSELHKTEERMKNVWNQELSAPLGDFEWLQLLRDTQFSSVAKNKGLSVKEKTLIQIAFSNEAIYPTCKTVFMYNQEYANFNVTFNWINSENKDVQLAETSVSEPILSNLKNQSKAKNYNFIILPAKHKSITGFYRCKTIWTTISKYGSGTFIMFREKGYEEPTPTVWICLITIIVILAVLSIIGTVLLFWKRKVLQPWKTKKCSNQGSACQDTSGNLEPDSTYTDLKPRQSAVYFAITKQADTPKHGKMDSDKVSHQKTQDETADVYENHSTDIYENI